MQHEVKRVQLTKDQLLQKYAKDQPKIKHYRELTDYLFDQRKSKVYNEETLKLTTSILQLNPEFYTMWNYRREIMDHVYSASSSTSDMLNIYISVLNNELNFILSLLKRFPKVYWIWNHRRWCLFKLVDFGAVDWGFEFKTVGKMLEMDQRNFHGWQYRRFVVENLQVEQLKKKEHNGCRDPKDGQEEKGEEKEGEDALEEATSKNEGVCNNLKVLKLYLDEFGYTTTKIQHDFSNFSAWHNRTKLIYKIHNLVTSLKKSDSGGGVGVGGIVSEEKISLFLNPLNVMKNDLEILQTGIYMSPEDNSVWLYLYWLLSDDIFVLAFKTQDEYLKVLKDQIKLIREVNELEKDDTGLDNVGCLKSFVFVRALIDKVEKRKELDDKEIVTNLEKLIKLDSLRRRRYEDQLLGKVPVL